MNKHEVKISNKKTGLDLKTFFCEQESLSLSEYKVRLLYKGQEIKETDVLSIYNFDSHPQVQVSCNKIQVD
jgi:hypothetical protein